MKKLRGILLIDDDDTNNFLNHRLLSRMKVTDHIKDFRNGKQALEYLSSLNQENTGVINPEDFKPALILVDINMPVMDGFEFLAQFDKMDPAFREDVVLALLTTSEHSQDTERAAASNVTYLTKPLTTEKVQELLSRYFPEESAEQA
jgi:CheY-like chemotaxis protein